MGASDTALRLVVTDPMPIGALAIQHSERRRGGSEKGFEHIELI
jgi:hypothetical protein